MAEERVENEIERRKPDIREHIDGVKFHKLAPGITTHPLARAAAGPALKAQAFRWQTSLVCKITIIWTRSKSPTTCGLSWKWRRTR